MKRIKSYISPFSLNTSLLLLASLLFIGCGETTEETGREATDGELVSVNREVRVHVQTMQAVGSAVTRGASDQRTKGESLHLTYVNDMDTRAQTGTEDLTSEEAKINNAYILQFDGTSAGSVLQTKFQITSSHLLGDAPMTPTFSMKVGVKNRVYVVANVPSTKTLTVGTTTLGDFEAPVTQAPSSSSVPTSGLPMSACQDVTSTDRFDIFQLRSRLAKLTFTCKTSGATMKLNGIPNGYTFCTQAASGSPVRPAGMTYTATAALTSGTTYYVPENLSGRNDLLIKHYTRALGMAPTNAMYVALTNSSVVYNILLGDGTPSDFNVVGGMSYAMTVTIMGTDTYDLRVGNPAGLSSITDLNGDGQTANCYIATSANSWYMFNNTVMGNGATTPLPADLNTSKSVAAPIVPENLNPVDADVLWETLNTTVSPVKGDVVNPTIYPLKDRILFKSGDKEGNAVIAARDASHNIIWSWHIWRTNTTPVSQPLAAITGFAAAGELVIMDRNLGALSAAAQNDLSTGVHYQWGRKDPMPAYAGFTSPNNVVMATQPAGVPVIPGSSAQYTVEQSIQQPTTFFKYGGDWCSTRNDNLWGTPLTVISGSYTTNKGSKTIYDPCPVGWRVPPGYTFSNASTSNGGTFNLGYSFGTGFLSSGSSWFPASGFRSSSNGALNYVGAFGYYWVAAPNAGYPTTGSYLGLYSISVDPASFSNRANAYSCRCAKE